MGALYQIAFPNGKSYIGMTIGSVEKRFNEHRYQSERGTHFPVYDAIRSFGIENVALNVLAISDSREYLELIERNAIRAFGTMVPNGYNLTEGGDGAPLGNKYQLGKKRSAASRIKMSEAALGRRHTEESKAKIGAASKGNRYGARKHSEAEIEKVRIANRGIAKGASSGFVGVSFHRGANKWRAHLTVNRKMVSLGYFSDIQDAVAARRDGERKYFQGASK